MASQGEVKGQVGGGGDIPIRMEKTNYLLCVYFGKAKTS